MRRWVCIFCQGEVVEGQRFTFLPGRGAVHVECLESRIISKRGDPDTVAILEANEALLYALVRLKQAERIARDARSEVEALRREVEGLAGKLARRLGELAD